MNKNSNFKVEVLKKKVFLFDLDGTLYLGKRVLPGAQDLISLLRAQGKKVFFFTNNSSKSKSEYWKKLKSMRLAKSPDEIIISTEVMARYLREKNIRRAFVLGTSAMKGMLKSAGISHDRIRPQAVVVGYDRSLTFQKLKEAAFWISKQKPFLVTHPDFFCPTEAGPEPDCGAFAWALALATKRDPDLILGKPHGRMIQEVYRRTKVKSSDMILVGDRLQTDIAMAKNAGISSILVLSGDSQRVDLRQSKLRPTFIMKDVRLINASLV